MTSTQAARCSRSSTFCMSQRSALAVTLRHVGNLIRIGQTYQPQTCRRSPSSLFVGGPDLQHAVGVQGECDHHTGRAARRGAQARQLELAAQSGLAESLRLTLANADEDGLLIVLRRDEGS